MVAVAVALWVLPALILIGKKPKTVEYHEASSGLISGVLKGLVRLNRKHPVAVLALALAMTLVFSIGTVWIKSELNNVSFFKPDSPIRQADDILNEKLAGTQNVVIILDSDLNPPVVGASGFLEAAPAQGDPVPLTTPAVLKHIDAFSEAVTRKFSYVHKVMSFNDVLKKMNQEMNGGDKAFFAIPDDPNLISQYLLIFSGDIQSQLSPNHDKLKISITMKRLGTKESEEVAEFSRAWFGGDFAKQNHLRVETTGAAHMYFVANELLLEGMIKSIVICVVLVFFLLLWLLKDLRMTLIAMCPIIATLLIDFGLLGILGIPLNTATAMVSSIAVGIGVDYSIHFITWYRSELRQKRDIPLALENSILHKGRAILYNMLVIVAGFMVLVFSNFVPLIQFGLLVSICMLTTAFGALAVVPAVIRVLAGKDRAWLYLDRGGRDEPAAAPGGE
jgi:predicted RND superfamily exporter protein